MRHIYLLFFVFLMFSSCQKERIGRYNKSTEDGITMSIDFQSYDLGKWLNEQDEAIITVTSSGVGKLDSTAIYIDGNLIENITHTPWTRKFQIGMLIAGDHDFKLIHTDNGITETLQCQFFTNNNRGLMNIFYPSN